MNIRKCEILVMQTVHWLMNQIPYTHCHLQRVKFIVLGIILSLVLFLLPVHGFWFSVLNSVVGLRVRIER